MCVRCAAVGHEKPKVCLVVTVGSEATDRYTLASLHMPTDVSYRQNSLGPGATELSLPGWMPSEASDMVEQYYKSLRTGDCIRTAHDKVFDLWRYRRVQQ